MSCKQEKDKMDNLDKNTASKKSNKPEENTLTDQCSNDPELNTGIDIDNVLEAIDQSQGDRLLSDDGENSEEDLKLKWDDDEIEEDFLSLNPPPSENDTLISKDTDNSNDGNLKHGRNDDTTLSTDSVEIKKPDEGFEVTNKDDEDKIDTLIQLSPIDTLESLQMDIDNMCNDIDNQIDKLDETFLSAETNPVKDSVIAETESIIDDKESIINEKVEEKNLKDQDSEKVSANKESMIEHLPVEEKDLSKVTDKQTEEDKAVISIIEDISKDKSDKETIATSSPNESLIDSQIIEANAEHGLNKPDMMLEIPTQEVIEFMDNSSVSITSHNESQESKVKEDETDSNVDLIDKCESQNRTDIGLERDEDVSSSIPNINTVDNIEMVKESKESLNKNKQSLLEGDTELESNLIKLESVDNTKMLESSEKETLENVMEVDTKQELNNEDSTAKEAASSPIKSAADNNIDDFVPTSSNDISTSDKIKEKSLDIMDSLHILESSEKETPENVMEVDTKQEFNSEDSTAKEAASSPIKSDADNNIDNSIPTSSNDISTSDKVKEKSLETMDSQQILEPSEKETPENVMVVDTKQELNNKDSTAKEAASSPIKSDADNNIDNSVPTSSNDISISDKVKEKPLENMDIQQPSTSKSALTQQEVEQLAPDSTDEVAEVSDSLGLLAESSRVMEDDEEPEDDEDGDGDGDDDDDFDQDESSNQMTAEHSEDSNAPQSENDMPKQGEKETDMESPQEEKGEEQFNFEIADVASESQDKDSDDQDKDSDNQDKDGDMDVDDVICEDEVEVAPEQIGDEPAPTDDLEIPQDDLEPATDDLEQATDDLESKKSEDKEKTVETASAMDIQTVRLSDASDNEVDGEAKKAEKEKNEQTSTKAVETTKSSPTKKLEISQPMNILNIVDLEESSSEDDVQEVEKVESYSATIDLDKTTKINLPSEMEVLASSKELSEPKEHTNKPRLNMDEITIKTATGVENTLVIPEINAKPTEEKPKPKFSLEIFSLDSDEEDSTPAKEPKPPSPQKETALETDKVRETKKCINFSCASGGKGPFYPANPATVSFFDAARKRKAMVCEDCALVVAKRTESLVAGIKEQRPLLELGLQRDCSELVEISDSDEEDELQPAAEAQETIGENAAQFLEKELAKQMNEVWVKYKMDSLLAEAQDILSGQMQKFEEEGKEIEALLDECQRATDKLRNDLYGTFEQERRELSPWTIFDTPDQKFVCLESKVDQMLETGSNVTETRGKRRMSSGSDTPAKRAAIPLGYAPLDGDGPQTTTPDKNAQSTPSIQSADNSKADDDKDISVMTVSMELAPVDLPPPGEISRPPLRPGMAVFAIRSVFGSWMKCRLVETHGKATQPGSNHSFTMCRVKFESKIRNHTKVLPARSLAYYEPADVRLTIGTRVIALFKDSTTGRKESFYSGIVAEVPNPVNNYRYLVFFDDGYAQYVKHCDTRLVCECSPLVWEEVHPFSREFVREYLMAYPERPMVRLHAGQSLKTEWNGKWWSSRVVKVDASLVHVHFEKDNRTEWIYRGSTRLAPLYMELQAAERHRARPMPRTKAQPRLNMPYVEYTRSDEQNKSDQPTPAQAQNIERENRQRAVAKKSTTQAPQPQPPPAPVADSVTSRVVYYTPKNAVKPYKMTPHTCGPQCRRTDVLALKDLRTYNPLAKPLLSGWERQIVRSRGQKQVMYRAPCGRRLRTMPELHRYLRAVQSDMAVDLFDFTPATHCLAEFVLNKCLVGKKDLSHGRENVPVPCVNYYDDSLPEFCSYNTERTPTAGVPLNLDPEFLCGCDCTDDCENKLRCACWQMTLEGARTIGLDGPKVGYEYKRLPEPLPSGIYECNSRCKCKQTCLNRVAQHPLQLKLQVFKTLNRGWGIRALNDVPKGSFLCVYAGNLLTDATANMDGLNEGDEYLAELDYIEVVEQMKEGFEEDIPEADKKLDKKNIAKPTEDEEEDEMSSSEEEEKSDKDDAMDDDFRPGHIGMGVAEFSKRLRKRDKKQIKKDKEKEKEGEQKGEDDCITISDDEEVREPSRFMAQAGMESNQFKPKYKSVRSYFGKDEACYIMDAKVQGNIGRYLNHSCSPNVFVQNVFVDTHDPRFPWVAFFALCHIKAGTELTWNYNYDVGSVPGKVLYCHCGASNCRGRLL